MTKWLTRCHARIIENSVNGWCLAQAMDAAYRTAIEGDRLPDTGLALDEAEFFKDLWATYLLHYRAQMSKDKTVHLPAWHARCFGLLTQAEEDSHMVDAISDFLYTTIELNCDEEIPAERWGGAEEIMGMVWGLRQPIFVFSVLPNDRVAIQVYQIEQTSPPSEFDEIMKIRPLTTEDTYLLNPDALGPPRHPDRANPLRWHLQRPLPHDAFPGIVLQGLE